MLEPKLKSKILGYLEEEKKDEKPQQRLKAWFEDSGCFHQESHGLVVVEDPLPQAAISQVLDEGYVVIDNFCGEKLCERALSAAESMCNELRPAKIGRGFAAMVDEDKRNDLISFLPPEKMRQKALQEIDFRLRQARAQLRWSGIVNDKTVSTQLALYPGGGSQYEKHADVREASSYHENEPRRALTAVYYMSHKVQGGALRITAKNKSTIDLEPKFDRLILFCSELEHQVLPVFSRRFALTQWWFRTSHLSSFLDYSKKKLRLQYDDSLDQAASGINASTSPPLPLALTQAKSNEETIFICIAAYRDPDLKNTLASLFATASHPERIFVGVALQYDTIGGADDHWLPPHHPRVRYTRSDYRDASGPCPARALAQSLYKDEDYVLQIDAHTRFRPNWDSFLISVLADARSLKPKPILTTYPTDFADCQDDTSTILAPIRFDDDGILRFVGRRLRKTNPHDTVLPSPAWCAGFSFARADALIKVPYDPHLHFLFFGEEQAMAARLFTHGFDFFTPTTAVLYHKWSRQGRPDFKRDHARIYGGKLQTKLRSQSLRRLAALFAHDSKSLEGLIHCAEIGPDLHCYSLGTERSLSDFEDQLKVDFNERHVSNQAKDAGLDKSAFLPAATSSAASNALALIAKLSSSTTKAADVNIQATIIPASSTDTVA